MVVTSAIYWPYLWVFSDLMCENVVFWSSILMSWLIFIFHWCTHFSSNFIYGCLISFLKFFFLHLKNIFELPIAGTGFTVLTFCTRPIGTKPELGSKLINFLTEEIRLLIRSSNKTQNSLTSLQPRCIDLISLLQGDLGFQLKYYDLCYIVLSRQRKNR